MSKFICKVELSKGTRYFLWSTVVDAPITYPLPFEDFIKEYLNNALVEAKTELEERMARAEVKGTSARAYKSFEELAYVNCYGDNGEPLTVTEVFEQLESDCEE